MHIFSQWIKIFVTAAVLFIQISTAHGQDADRFKDVQIETARVGDGIYMLQGEGGNIGVSAGDDGVFMIDDQFAPLTAKIKAAIAKLSDKPIRFLINTHWHGDHTGGNENLGKEGVVIVAHDNVRRRMSQENYQALFKRTTPPAPPKALPLITFNDNVTFHLNGQTVRAIHVSHAHTDGDSILHFQEANVIHSGDIIFNGTYPFIDEDSGGSVDGVIQAVRQILDLADAGTAIIPGHGPLTDREGVQAYLKMLVTTRDRMQKLINAGKTLDEIKAMKPNSDYDPTHGNGFIKSEVFLEILYSSLTKD